MVMSCIVRGLNQRIFISMVLVGLRASISNGPCLAEGGFLRSELEDLRFFESDRVCGVLIVLCFREQVKNLAMQWVVKGLIVIRAQ